MSLAMQGVALGAWVLAFFSGLFIADGYARNKAWQMLLGIVLLFVGGIAIRVCAQ